jgi:glycopeptide antibiotics resistance protein
MNINSKERSKGIICLFILITVSIFYFSWIPDSQFTSESYLPEWLRDWSNSYFNLRTAVPFVGFGFLLDACTSKIDTVEKRRFKFSSWFRNSGAAMVVAFLAEGGQFFVLNRHPDLADVLFGVAGSQLGFLLYYIYAFQLHRFYAKR